ncbi:MAG: RNA degradosome polyphosphate kinase [Neomegalonema sp.]|nr:RNA degradosome polyphosphate kinase [Neomegalonema sp.]
MRADFLNIFTPPNDDEAESPDISSFSPRDRYFNRELSWLAFNWRVLEEAQNLRAPLMERLRFLSISASNLDEFYMVRMAGLRGLVRRDVKERSADGRTPQQQLAEADADARKLMKTQERLWRELRIALKEAGVEIVEADALSASDAAYLERYFLDQVFPVATPLAIEPTLPFPFIPNKGVALALQLRSRLDEETRDALIPIPPQLRRFVPLPTGETAAPGAPPQLRFVALETIIGMFLDRLFPGYTISAQALFRILRDSDIEIEEEAEDLVSMFQTALRRRRRGRVVRMKIEAGAPDGLTRRLVQHMGVDSDTIIEVENMIGVSDLSQLIDDKNRPDLCWPPYTPRMPERLRDYHSDIFAAIREKDMLLQHPYESFEAVTRFLQQAAQDPDVVSIRQTLYRTVEDSPIVQALVEAAEAGKSVVALVELKARFDEAANIRLAKILEPAGAQVVYGFTDLKTHAKMSSVVRREHGELVTYTHLGTGNYHPITAKIYTDLSLFTCDPVLARDCTRLFNYIGSHTEPQELELMRYAPVTLKSTLLEHLEVEAANARAGKPAQVWAKMNSLIEQEVIDALYRASQAGVRIDLIIRGICGLRPGVKGLSENIRVKSIVGRFLEHSRIVCFANGAEMPSNKAKVYISSADWMDRNLNRRVETLAPILNDTVRNQILEQVMAANLADEAQSWVLQSDGAYVRAAPPEDIEPFNVHEFFMSNPSLSGRGLRGAEDAPRLRPRAGREDDEGEASEEAEAQQAPRKSTASSPSSATRGRRRAGSNKTAGGSGSAQPPLSSA